MEQLVDKINRIWDERENIKLDINLKMIYLQEIDQAFELINQGKIRAAKKLQSEWIVEEIVKKTIILYFIFSDPYVMRSEQSNFYDKISLKYQSFDIKDFKEYNSRFVPGSIIRHGAYIGKNVVIMPSFINVGAYIDDFTMIDSCVTIGSCAQIGKKCHISSGVTIGGVLEPIGDNPVIIEDSCFIGAGSQILEGVIIEENSIIGAGVTLSASTKIIYRDTGEIIYGYIPKNSVVVSGSYGGGIDSPALSCAVIIKNVTPEIRGKLSINQILRN